MEIEYPCAWDFLIITSNSENLVLEIEAQFGERKYRLEPSKTRAKYASYNFNTQVSSQSERDEIFRALSVIKDVHIVI